jgi:two-component system, response regulator
MEKYVILLVEDNPDDEELALRIIKQTTSLVEVVVTRDGEEALDYLFGTGKFIESARTHHPNLILLDLKLPKMSGLEVLERLRTDPRTRTIPVVVLTSSSERKDIQMSYQLGANSFVRKPVDFQRFTAALQQLILYWVMLNEKLPIESR